MSENSVFQVYAHALDPQHLRYQITKQKSKEYAQSNAVEGNSLNSF